MGEDANSPSKTFWQIVADPKHPFWKFIYVALIVPAMYMTVNNFDETELNTLLTWAGSAGGLAAVLKIVQSYMQQRDGS